MILPRASIDGQRRWLALAACAVTLVAAPAARAQSTEGQAAAEALFEQGRDLMGQGKFALACPKFAESQRLDPAPGTLLNLATCYERNGQLASAWVTYKEGATAAQNADQLERAQFARRKAAELAAKLPTLTVVVPPAADRPDLQISRDREALGRPAWGVPIPVDPGLHTVEATGPGRRTWQGQASVEGPGSKASIEVPPLEAAPDDATAAAVPGANVGSPAASPSQPEANGSAPLGSSGGSPPGGGGVGPTSSGGSRGSGQRAIAWVTGGVGLAGLAVGGVFGFIAMSDNNTAGKHCLTNSACDPQGVSSDKDAHDAATVATVAFIAGGALAAAGIVLYLTAPGDRAPSATSIAVSPLVGSTAAGLSLRGGW